MERQIGECPRGRVGIGEHGRLINNEADNAAMWYASLTPTGRSVLAVSTALLLVTVSCSPPNLGPPQDTTVVFDGQTYTIHAPVSCRLVPDGKLQISAATERGKKLIWVSLTRDPPLVVETVTFRHFDARGATNNSHEMSATKVDKTYTTSGRMPPDEGETTTHQFKIEVSCWYIPEVPDYGTPQPRIPY